MGAGAMSARRAVFLDRDGVLNEHVFYADTGSWEAPRRVEEFHLLPGVVSALKSLRAAGYVLVLVSNQPNEALGKSTHADFMAIHNAMAADFDRHGVCFLEYCYCRHHPKAIVSELGGACGCRKPSPYWLLQTAVRHDIDLGASWMIGDRATDTACGAAAGVRTIRVGSGTERDGHAEFQAEDLAAAVRLVLGPGESAHQGRAL